jgi:hypothetical protein
MAHAGMTPDWGRFLSADTVVPGATNPQALNRYSYVYNRPVIYSDPSGHCPFCVIVGVLAAFSMQSGSAPQSGTSVLERNSFQILAVAQNRNVNPVILGAIIDHESTNIFRLGGAGDWLSKFVRQNPSIGIGQVQLAMAERIEDAGYMPRLPGRDERVDALLDESTNVDYSGATLQLLEKSITEYYDGQGVPISSGTLDRLMMFAYNQGWQDPNSGVDVYDNLEKYKLNRGLLILTYSLAWQGKFPGFMDEIEYTYHTSLMWNPERILSVEEALGIQYERK